MEMARCLTESYSQAFFVYSEVVGNIVVKFVDLQQSPVSEPIYSTLPSDADLIHVLRGVSDHCFNIGYIA